MNFVSVVDNACKPKDGVNRNPCKNGAKCEFDDKNGEITCICPTSYEGPTCNGKATILTEICKLYVLRNREEKSLRHVAMVAKFLDLNKPCSCKYGKKRKRKRLAVCDLLMVALRTKR